MLSKEQIKTASTDFLTSEVNKSINFDLDYKYRQIWKLYINSIKEELKKRKMQNAKSNGI